MFRQSLYSPCRPQVVELFHAEGVITVGVLTSGSRVGDYLYAEGVMPYSSGLTWCQPGLPWDKVP